MYRRYHDVEDLFNQTIIITYTGKISDDLSTVNRELLDNAEGDSGEFTLTR